MIRLPAGRPVRIRLIPYWLLISLLYSCMAWGGEWGGDWDASPYLAMHTSDPVHWRSFGPEALQRAQRDGKLIFISSGYFACHWCHVMQRESFRDPRVADLLNGWVATLIDRELEPALDAALIDFVRRTQGIAGWPLNVVLTREGYPLLGFTYLPADRVLKLLAAVEQRWEKEPEHLQRLAREAAEELAREARPPPGPSLSAVDLQRSLQERALELADDVAGGFGAQGKFPQIPQLSVLLNAYKRSGDERLGKFLRLTLDQMASQGLCDHLSGGFFRYTVDPAWQVPHFEKMLYDNAQLAVLYLEAAQALSSVSYLRVARETLDFMRRELATTPGTFAASLSAIDNQGTEGGAYLWDRASLERLLTKDELGALETFWHMDRPAPFAGGYLPADKDTAAPGLVAKVESAYVMLRAARRAAPRDEKRVAGWNGLALSALSRAFRLGGSGAYREAAGRLRADLLANLWDGRVLRRAAGSHGMLPYAGTLEDYAYVAAGLWDWSKASGEHSDLPLIGKLLSEAWKRFHVNGGWRLAEQTMPLVRAMAAIPDGVLPSAQAVLLDVSLKWAERTGDEDLKTRVQAELDAVRPLAATEPFRYASLTELLVRSPAKAPPPAVEPAGLR